MKKGEQTQDFILEKSAELFNLYGYNRTSLSDIMKATGLKKGGIYNHFKSKDDIAKASFDRAYERVIRRFRHKLDECDTSAQKLYSIVETFRSLNDNPVYAGGCPIYNTAMESIDAYPEMRRKASDAVTSLYQYIVYKLEEGRKSGEFYADIDSEEVATVIMSTLEGAMILTRVNDNTEHLGRAVKFVNNYLKTQVIKPETV
jgi:TetR/AcrR family transcriptional regulator, transcriptional repressor for nem operon